jgi:hypothetical protein
MDSPSPHRRGFDFTRQIRLLCRDIVATTADLHHVDLSRVGVSFAQARKRTEHGLYASLTPLRFEQGRRTNRIDGRMCGIQRVRDECGRELLYILNFYLPRFMDQPFLDKLTTVFHELWHISPRCDGDLRRHGGRCYLHTGSQAEYDAAMERLARYYLQQTSAPELHAFLRFSFEELRRRYVRVYGTKIPHPKVIPL